MKDGTILMILEYNELVECGVRQELPSGTNVYFHLS